MKSKHKLSGYAIKGDGTRETAERIRNVFEADGWKVSDWTFKTDSQYGCPPVGQLEVDPIGEGREHGNQYTVIPLTEAEALVFGGLKVGMKVVCVKDFYMKDGERAFTKGNIYPINEGMATVDDMEVNHYGMFGKSFGHHFRRATITDFLRTLPEDIAERALRQVSDTVKDEYCETLAEAVRENLTWKEETDEGSKFWQFVSTANYDRARAILAENDKDGKWAEIITPAPEKPKPYTRRVATEQLRAGKLALQNNAGLVALKKAISEVWPDCKVLIIGGSSFYLGYEGNPYSLTGFDEPNDIPTIPVTEFLSLTNANPEPTDKFPRVMWVWDVHPKNAYPFTVIRHDSGAIRPWRSEFESFKYACDTHPVTGEPAVKKDVVEMIREVVESDVADEWKVSEIKEILTKTR